MRGLVNLKQETEYSCGASCVLSILNTLGIFAREAEIRHELRTNPKCGTAIESICDFFKVRGFYSKIAPMTVYDLQESMEMGDFVILLMQYEDGKSYWGTWSEGHYCVLTGVDDSRVWLHDPYRGGEITLTHRRLKELWHDKNYGKVYYNIGVRIGFYEENL